VTISALTEDSLILGEWKAVLEPGDFGLGRGVNDADDLRFVVLSGVDERLLLVDARSV
jgi:hypothetical protein